jgi:hypothetical protein
MIFLPFENFYIITSLNPEQVQDYLQQEVEPGNGFSFKSIFSSSSDKYFSGYVINGTFEFKRVISYRNSFLPQIKGSTEAWINGSRIHVTMRMHIAVIIFMCMWLGGVGLAGVGILLRSFSKGVFEPTTLIPFGMFLFGYVLATGGFKYESSKARNKLVELLNGEIAQ